MARGAPRDELRRLLEPVVVAAGLELEDVTVTPAGKRRVVRVVVDRDGGVSLDGVAAASHAVSEVLDAGDGERALGSQPYVLEVSSPGVDRPLREPRHWRRARGRLVSAVLADGSTLVARVEDVDDEQGVLLDVDGAPRRLAWESVRSARVEVEFSRPGAEDEDDEGVAGDADRAEE